MKVNLLNNFYPNSLLTRQKSNEKSENNFKYNNRYSNVSCDIVSFGNKSQIPAKALKSLQTQKEQLLQKYKLEPSTLSLSLFNLKELEGLQNGIEIFEGLSFQQIACLISNLNEIVIQRGCNNLCIHCYANAKTPHYMKMHNFADKIAFEDYENLINGFGEINNRLGFNAFNNARENSFALFHDSDCSTIYLRDKNGKIHDYADLAKMLHDVTGEKVLFDTSGWNIKDTKTQKRMEALVQKITNSDEYDFMQFNVSINPFHSLFNKSIELAENGNVEKSKKLREIYIDRIANAIFTFSPLLEKRDKYNRPMLDAIVRTLNVYSDPIAYSGSAFRETNYRIFENVCQLYEQDLESSCPKVIKNKRQLIINLDTVHKFLRDIDYGTYITNERLLSKIKDANSVEYGVTRGKMYNSVHAGKLFDSGILDINGDFYMFNFIETYPTDIVLNYSNKGKLTAPIEPNLRDGVITKRMIENLY